MVSCRPAPRGPRPLAFPPMLLLVVTTSDWLSTSSPKPRQNPPVPCGVPSPLRAAPPPPPSITSGAHAAALRGRLPPPPQRESSRGVTSSGGAAARSVWKLVLAFLRADFDLKRKTPSEWPNPALKVRETLHSMYTQKSRTDLCQRIAHTSQDKRVSLPHEHENYNELTLHVVARRSRARAQPLVRSACWLSLQPQTRRAPRCSRIRPSAFCGLRIRRRLL